MRPEHRTRNPRGNMLVLGCVVMALLSALVTLACSFGSVIFTYSRLEASASEIALEGARALNARDRVGQMNNMIGRCRQLVYSSSKNYDEVIAHYPQLEALARQQRDEAREGAEELERQRVVLLNYATTSATSAMQAKWDGIKDGYPLVLPWLKVRSPLTPSFTFGKIANIESNVVEFAGFPDLADRDRESGYVRPADSPFNPAAVSLYRQCIDNRLPAPNEFLSFKLTSLPAPVGGIISPARVVRAAAFEPVPGDQIPSATRVRLNLPVSTALGAAASGLLSATGSAAATGADVQL